MQFTKVCVDYPPKKPIYFQIVHLVLKKDVKVKYETIYSEGVCVINTVAMMMMMIINQSYFEFLTLFIANDNQKKDRMKVQVLTNCA